jgi:hypothetical protein
MKMTSLTLLFALLVSTSLHAQDAGTTPSDPTTTPAPTTDTSSPAPTDSNDVTKTKAPKADLKDLEKKVEDKYSITPDRMSQLQADGLKLKDIATAAEIAKESGKSLDDVLAMRKDKKGWGAIAKELNVSPDRIGQAMAELRGGDKAEKKDKKERKERKEDREDKGDKKEDRDEKRDEHREDKKEKRDDRREERKERREDRKENREDRQERREERKDDARENRRK